MGVHPIEILAFVASQQREHAVRLDFHVASLVGHPLVPDGRAGVIKDHVVALAAAASVVNEDGIRARIVVGGDAFASTS